MQIIRKNILYTHLFFSFIFQINHCILFVRNLFSFYFLNLNGKNGNLFNL